MDEKISIKPLNGTAAEIARLIGGYFVKTKKEYSLIDQQWMLRCLEDWYGHKIQRSVLCYNLKQLVAAGYINRVTRHRRNPETGAFEPRVTLYKMTFRLKAFILRIAAYMRGIGWKNHITAPVRRAAATAKAAARKAAEELALAAAPPMELSAFKAWGREFFGARPA